ncbi:hypothetical protein [uncultured Clostridium sp.]|uniref:hypothetical protein n=1 Tax=uncultured Clostridium sp. TaxID=59620 RepID=UPI002586F631|nr:hypothetical protein [uncultured Clostridium sp.]MDU1350577.1 hypothetical protein [Clostridium argentinense]
MNYSFEIVYDVDMAELLEDERITTSTLKKIFENFVQEKLELIDNENVNFILPFVNPISDKGYTLYGNYQFKNSHIKFEVELVGISIKTVKIKPC